jgi:23S rRNA (cytosine1962-C5)-methyltransferase
MTPQILITKKQKDYELIDSGAGEKLERYGDVLVSRPDPQALWPKMADEKEWAKAHAQFSRTEEKPTWKLAPGLPERWQISFGDLSFWIRPGSFKHTGIFPEQLPNWTWIREQIKKGTAKKGKPLSILNLFGYTGGATLVAAKAGAEVCHVDGSKSAVQSARENAEASDLTEKPIRWIVDDVRAFLKRESKRGRIYDGVIMDPPSFGRGPNGEVWKIEENFIELLELVKQVLVAEPAFILINGYAAGYSAQAYENSISSVYKVQPGTVETGELMIEATYGNRLLPAGIFARWSGSSST